jgi:hypothetical protein
MENDEYYKYVPNHPEYIVSNHGDIKRTGRRSGKPMGMEVDENGTLLVHLWISADEMNVRKLDRLVAQAFLETPPDFHRHTVIHLDGDPNNCSANNLQWSDD